jgi:hypothetical protein
MKFRNKSAYGIPYNIYLSQFGIKFKYSLKMLKSLNKKFEIRNS